MKLNLVVEDQIRNQNQAVEQIRSQKIQILKLNLKNQK
jgi:hypothetical protein